MILTMLKIIYSACDKIKTLYIVLFTPFGPYLSILVTVTSKTRSALAGMPEPCGG